MTKISAGMMFFNKRVAPALVVGMFCLPAIAIVLSGQLQHLHLVLLIAPLVGAVLVFFLFKKMVFDLADEVFDCGDYLLVRKGGEEAQIALANIMNVSESYMVNPPRVTLRLRQLGVFGREVAFSPKRPLTFNPFARNVVIDELIERIDRIRQLR